jgi:methylmalonyl-CoA mutase cobalamin-binding subunit
MVGFKVLRSFYANCGYSVETSAERKTDRSTVLTVKSGLDPHMINELKDGLILLSGYSCGLAELQP